MSTTKPLSRTVLSTAAVGLGTLISVVLGAASASAAPPPRSSGSDGVAKIAVSFEVKNVNRSKVACQSDGKTYTIRGHLVGPAGQLDTGSAKAATLYLHGLSFGEFFWNFTGGGDYDYAANQARAGQTSVVIDRLGYGSSDKLDGNNVCVGSRADMAHQMVLSLRSGNYQVDKGQAPRFSRVALAGHSYGGQIAQVEAYSFGDIDGLVVMGYSDRVQSALLKSNAAYAANVCATGGKPVDGNGPAGYASFGPPSGAPGALFHSATSDIQKAVLPLLTIDPCGDTASFPAAVKVDLANVANIHVPVLIITGASDKLFPPPAGPDQAKLFTGSSKVTQVTLPETAHAFTFEQSHLKLSETVNRWQAVPTGGMATGDGGAAGGPNPALTLLGAGALLAAAGSGAFAARRARTKA